MRGSILSGVAAALLAGSAVMAEQAVIIDQDMHWQNEVGVDRKYTGSISQYLVGNAYMKLDLTARPTEREVGIQMCLQHFSPSLKEQCSWSGQALLTAVRAYYFDMGEPSQWWTNGGGVDWSMNMGQLNEVRILLRDPNHDNCQFYASGPAACAGIGSDLPLDFHVTVIFVAEDDRLVAPQGWECPSEWDCEGTAAAAPAPLRQPRSFFVKANRPANGSVEIAAPPMTVVRVTNLRGETVAAGRTDAGGRLVFSAASLAPGMYVAVCSRNAQSTASSFIVQPGLGAGPR
jgi:hypothetical protein